MNFALALLIIIEQLSPCGNSATRRGIGDMPKFNTGFYDVGRFYTKFQGVNANGKIDRRLFFALVLLLAVQ